jgi:hypothetical protein
MEKFDLSSEEEIIMAVQRRQYRHDGIRATKCSNASKEAGSPAADVERVPTNACSPASEIGTI